MAEMTSEEAFRLLGASPDCDEAELTKAFRDLSLQHHPDTGGSPSEMQARLNEAREVVSALSLTEGPWSPSEFNSRFMNLIASSRRNERPGRLRR